MKDETRGRFITDGGTVFVVKDGKVVITAKGQPECTIPLSDLREFIGLFDLDDDDFDPAPV